MFSNEHLKGTICSQKNIVLSILIHKNKAKSINPNYRSCPVKFCTYIKEIANKQSHSYT